MPALDPKSLLALVVTDEEVAAHIPASAHIRVFTHASGTVLDKFSKIFVSVPLVGLSEVSEFVKEANERHYLRSFLVRDADSSNLLPQYLYRANMRSLRNLIVHSDFQVPGRVLKAHVLAAEHDLIADARLVGDQLVVISCAGEVYDLSLEEIRTLAGSSSSEGLHSFKVEEDGSYVYWPTLDLHLDLRSIQERLNPEIKEQSRTERLQSDQLFGRAVAEFRRRCHLKQADISGLSARQVSRIEHGEPTKISSLKVLARAHKVPFNDYLNALAEVVQELKAGN